MRGCPKLMPLEPAVTELTGLQWTLKFRNLGGGEEERVPSTKSAGSPSFTTDPGKGERGNAAGAWWEREEGGLGTESPGSIPPQQTMAGVGGGGEWGSLPCLRLLPSSARSGKCDRTSVFPL